MFDKKKIFHSDFEIETIPKNSPSSKPSFIVTIDTEADNAWDNPTEINIENMKAIPRFQDLCEKYDITPTYLVAYECATRDEAIKVLKPILDRGKCEIGHHLHVWSTPPFQRDNGSGVDLDWIQAYQSELPDSLFFEKSEVLKKAIEENYGVSPKSHRAGRLGVDKRTIKWLMKNNFTVDSSILPLINYSDKEDRNSNGPNFYFEENDPYILKDSGRKIFEIPISIDDTPQTINCLLKIAVAFGIIESRIAYKILRKMGGGTSLVPSTDFTKEMYARTVEKHLLLRRPLVTLLLHSTEISFGHSPLTSTKEGLENYFNTLENTFNLAKKNGLQSKKLMDALS